MQRMSKAINVTKICIKFGFKSISLRNNTKMDMTLPGKKEKYEGQNLKGFLVLAFCEFLAKKACKGQTDIGLLNQKP